MKLIKFSKFFNFFRLNCWRKVYRWLTKFKILFKSKTFKLKTVLYSLMFNVHANSGYIADTLMEPLFWFVDRFTKILGPFFVAIVILLISLYVSIAYLIGLPFWWNRNKTILTIALLLGNYILVNVIFHYYMALTTSPGYPPQNQTCSQVVSICKRCMNPKPPRAHHCSVCDKCILKMDHHCPWLNNCIGHYNHRFFFMFCFYTWTGTIFSMIFGVVLVYQHFYPSGFFSNKDTFRTTTEYISNVTTFKDSCNNWLETHINSNWKNNAIVFEMLSCIGTFFAIGALGAWHAKLITKGETCIESHINKKERAKCVLKQTVYQSPFDKGCIQNWKIFLGLNRSDIKLRHILMPSNHLPLDDGLSYET